VCAGLGPRPKPSFTFPLLLLSLSHNSTTRSARYVSHISHEGKQARDWPRLSRALSVAYLYDRHEMDLVIDEIDRI